MNIAVELRPNPNPNDAVAAYATLILDGILAVHDVKLIRRRKFGNMLEQYIVAMPSKKILHPCRHCSEKNHLRANFCGGCGRPLEYGTPPEPDKWYADMVHPLDAETRRRVTFAVLQSFRQHLLTKRANHELPTDGPATPAFTAEYQETWPAPSEAGGPGNDRGEVDG